MTPYLRFVRPILLSCALSVGVASAASAQTSFTPDQRTAIEGIIKEYLVKNPEVLQEAIGELERRQAEAQKKAQNAALAEVSGDVLSGKNGVVVGNPDGNATLVEFFDYNCGYCKRALTDLRGLMKTDPKLRVVLRDLPVLGPDSLEASKIAIAAKSQLSGEKAFEYHARLLESRGRVGGEQALALAKSMGLDMARIQKDMAGADVLGTITGNTQLAERLGMTGTPAYVVGNEVISGAVGLPTLQQAIENARANADKKG